MMFPNSPNALITLISIVSEVDSIGVKRNVISSSHEVIANLKSITSLEHQTSVETKKNYTIKASIQSFLYNDEKFCKVNGVLYKIERTFVNGCFIELYLADSNVEISNS